MAEADVDSGFNGRATIRDLMAASVELTKTMAADRDALVQRLERMEDRVTGKIDSIIAQQASMGAANAREIGTVSERVSVLDVKVNDVRAGMAEEGHRTFVKSMFVTICGLTISLIGTFLALWNAFHGLKPA